MNKCLNCDNEVHEKTRKFCSPRCSTVYRIKRGEHFSLFVKGHKVRVGMKHPQSFILKRRGAGNPAWKGDKVGIHSLHTWIVDNFGNPGKCEICGTEKSGSIYDWSNKDHKYTRNREDWQFLCRGCHMRYDYDKGLRNKKNEIEKMSSNRQR